MQTETVSKVVAARLKECKVKKIKQADIAVQVGFNNPNMITHIKQGKSKLPPEKAPKLAHALGMDENHLLYLALNEKWDGIGDFIYSNIDRFREIALIEKTFWKILDDLNVNYDELTEQQQKNLLFKLSEFICKSK